MDLLLAAAVFVGVTSFQGRNLIEGGAPAPDFSLEALDGGRHTLSEHRGKRVLLVFWAPWCGVCKVESGNVSAIHASGDEGVEVLSVVVGYEDRAAVERFVEEHGVDYPVLMGDGRLARQYAVTKFPTLYVVDEEGRIEHAELGYTSELGLRWRLFF